MNLPFAIAGLLALMAAGIHGIAGEALVVSRLPRETLSPTRFGGRTMTFLMIRVTWHVATLAFGVLGFATAACAVGSSGGACSGVGRVTSVAFASFGVLAIALALSAGHGFRAMRRHPGPLVFLAVACLAWWGTTL